MIKYFCLYRKIQNIKIVKFIMKTDRKMKEGVRCQTYIQTYFHREKSET